MEHQTAWEPKYTRIDQDGGKLGRWETPIDLEHDEQRVARAIELLAWLRERNVVEYTSPSGYRFLKIEAKS